MSRLIVLLFSVCLLSPLAFAQQGKQQAQSFADIYASTCMKHLANLDELREQLQTMPKLPPEKAGYFLAGSSGDAWPIPDKHGTVVLSLLSGKPFCALYVRRADTNAAKTLFEELVAMAPAPLAVKLVQQEQAQTAVNGLTETVAYEWSVPNAARKMLFTLTTAASDSAQLQVLATASMVTD